MNWGLSSAAQETARPDTGDWTDLEAPAVPSVDARALYARYHGHPLPYLYALHAYFRGQQRPICWLAGDSSLDNKHWLYPTDDKLSDPLRDDSYTGPALNGYQHVLRPPRCVKDVCYWLNEALQGKASPYVALNTRLRCRSVAGAREPHVLSVWRPPRWRTGSRGRCLVSDCGPRARWAAHVMLAGQDLLIRDHMRPDDVLVVSVGGNDVALRPSLSTIAAVSWLAFASSAATIEAGTAYGTGAAALQLSAIAQQQLQAT